MHTCDNVLPFLWICREIHFSQWRIITYSKGAMIIDNTKTKIIDHKKPFIFTIIFALTKCQENLIFISWP